MLSLVSVSSVVIERCTQLSSLLFVFAQASQTFCTRNTMEQCLVAAKDVESFSSEGGE